MRQKDRHLCPMLAVNLKGIPVTAEPLRQAGCFVNELPGMEIALKVSGSLSCITRP